MAPLWRFGARYIQLNIAMQARGNPTSARVFFGQPSGARAPRAGGTWRSMTNSETPISAAPTVRTVKNGTTLPAPNSSTAPPKPLAEMALLKQSRLSVQPVTAAEWKTICRIGGVKA